MKTSGNWTDFAKNWQARGLILALALSCTSVASGQASREYDVKAAFLYNFITFTEWPADAFSEPGSPYVIGVLGDDPFGPVLDEMVNGEKINMRPLVVRRFKRIEDMHRCHILFICASEAYHLPEILRRLKGQPVLTVSDLSGFAETGGDIGFVSASRIKLFINPAALRSANLAVSSKLLRLAQLVPEGRSEP
jgi:YfiR/HmsC-like